MPLPPFWTLAERHGDELLAYARKLAGDAAEDVLQEALLRALRSYPRLRHGEHLRAWLYRITTTTAFDHTARAGREIPVGTVAGEGAELAAEDGFEAILEGLSEGIRRALELRFVDDLAYAEIGRRLDCSEEAARRRVATGLRTLRRRLQR